MTVDFFTAKQNLAVIASWLNGVKDNGTFGQPSSLRESASDRM